ncbi:hypothetical protein ORI89_14990 [Sphingobacterium sp. UT-1RO-CII-1]|uniref:NAD-dependent epimerase/dehydratase family protein n=1 Tax=Sphingobacterium sp. UT-1RO-CII-1 TaxID=2995225 RepID=UPI00227ACA96|nr:NAD-dependent epimerase/dehydratase family protein [Sphingobacterium sp. UT-1RO-CII-1]MCY4780964.1 hypothetical protein [Sphingobacterium sp. UT-1RO-CII-1]
MDALHQKRVLITGAAGFLGSHLCDPIVAAGFQVIEIYKLLFSDYQLPVNIGTPDEITVPQPAKEILTQTKSKAEIGHSKLPMDDLGQRRPDISTAKMILNWFPVIDRKIGLQRTIEYYRNLK